MGTPTKCLTVLVFIATIYHVESWFIPPIRIPPIRIPIFRKVGRFFVRVGKVFKKGFDILTKGCCGLHPSYCSNRKEFEKHQRQIKSKSAAMDRDWKYVKQKLEEIKIVNINNQIMFRHVRRVTLASTLTVETIDPKILAKMNEVSNELKKAIRAKNETVRQYNINDIGKEFEKTEKETKTELLDITGIGGFGMTQGFLKMTADMFKLVKLDGVAKFLTTEVGGFLKNVKVGISKLFGFHYLEKLAKTNKAARAVLGVLNFFNTYLNIANGVFKIFEIFGKIAAWITDLATCNKRKREMEVNLRDIKKKHNDINNSNRKLQQQKRLVNQNWGVVFSEAKNEGLLTNLKEIEKIAQHSSRYSRKMAHAVKVIRNYRKNIARSNPKGVISLQRRLIESVGNITYTSECYQRKMAVLATVSDHCRLGKGSLKQLFVFAVNKLRANSDECRSNAGLPYTSYHDVEKYVKKKSKRLNFEFDCLLNSGVKLSVVCKQLHHGYSLKQAAKKAEVNESTADIYQASCPIMQLSPMIKKSLCDMKKYKSQKELKRIFVADDIDMVSKALAECK